MEDMRRRGLSKPPLYPDNKSYINPSSVQMLFPSTLSKAFEKNPHYMNVPSGDGKSDAVSPAKMVDLNMPPFPHVIPVGEGTNKKTRTNSPPINEKCPIDDGVESGSSSKGKRTLTLDEAVENEKSGRDIDPMDERKLRRTVSNRLSAQRSRTRMSEYIADLQKKIKELQEYVASLGPKLEIFKMMQTMLRMQKTVLEQKLNSSINKSNLCNRQIEENRAEIQRLRELYKMQKDQMMMNTAAAGALINSTSHPFYPLVNYQQVPSSSIFQCEKPKPALVELGTNGGGIEQYLNLDVLRVSSSQATNVTPTMKNPSGLSD